MKNFLATLTVLILLPASASASVSPPSQGSTVLVPPLISKSATSKSKLPTIVRLPTQAGKVSKMVTTNLVAKGPSWIAKGDKYYSLCMPNRDKVACAPIVATSVMTGIEVGAVAAENGEPLITFKLDARLAPKRAVYAINYFLARTNKQVAHFNRMAVSYAPVPRQNSLKVGPTSNLVDAEGVEGCSYDDYGSYDCTGGSGGYESSGGGGGGDPIGQPTGQCEGNCTYPSGNSNGDSDPCIDPDGNRICNSPSEIPSVPVTGQRPAAEEPMSLPTCRPTGPFTAECGRLPPVIGGETLPKGPMPWFPQAMCNFASIFCSAGQEPDNDRGDSSSTSGKSMSELYNICEQIEAVERDVCRANRANMDNRSLQVCYNKATTRKLACYATARSLTNGGANPAP